MASEYYLVYSIPVDESSGAQSSLLRLYTDENGTPLSTGTLLKTYAGQGPTLTAALVDGTYKANKSSWTETMTESGGSGTLEVEVSGAGTDAAVIRFDYGESELLFDASALLFTQSQAFPAFFMYNAAGTPAPAVSGGYSSSIASVTALGPTGLQVEGTLDPAAETHTLRRRTSEVPYVYTETALAGTSEEAFPVQIYGLEPDTVYYFEIVSNGARGESVSETASGRTAAAAALAPPAFEVADTESAGVKKAVIADVAGAAYFDLEIAAGGDFANSPLAMRVTNSGGAEVWLREWPESADGSYAVRVRSVSGSGAYTDSAWSEAVQTNAAAGEESEESGAEMIFYSNIAIQAEPSAGNHAATVSKVNELVAAAVNGVGTVVNSVGGCTGPVTLSDLMAKAAEENLVVRHSTEAAPNPNNSSVITSTASDSQLASARAVYYYVQNVRSTLAGRISEHVHTYLYAPDGETILAAPELEAEGTIVSDTALAAPFDSSATYEAGAVVCREGYLYRNTSGTTSTGNRDFIRKWQKVVLADLLAAASGGTESAGRYETEFYGADLDGSHAVEITHGLGEQYVSAELVEITDGGENPVVGAQVNLLSSTALRLTFSDGLPGTARIKVIVRV